MSKPEIKYDYLVFVEHTTPVGLLPAANGAQACWYFFGIAHSIFVKAGKSTEDQILIEGSMWVTKRYYEQKLAVAKMYNLDSPSELDKYWTAVREEVARLRLRGIMYPYPEDEYVNAGPGKESYYAG